MTPEFRAPDTLEEALALLAERGVDAKLLAGGTALVILMKQRLVRPDCVISLGRVPGLASIEDQAGGLRIGALATHRAIETSSVVAANASVLAETLHGVATVRIRNVGTLGGNLAHADPALDPPVTLIALDASVRLLRAGAERVVALDQFFKDYYETVVQPDEILVDIRVPALAPRTATSFFKFLPRSADDYATVSVGTRLTLDPSMTSCEDVRIVLGAAGSTPIRANRAEAVLRGQPIAGEALREAAAVAKTEVDPVSDARGSVGYKRDMAEVFVNRGLVQNLDRLMAS